MAGGAAARRVRRTARRCRCRRSARAADGQPVLYGIRPEHCARRRRGDGLPVEVVVVEPTGADTQLYCRFNGQEVTAMVRDRVDCRAGRPHRARPRRAARPRLRRRERCAARRLNAQRDHQARNPEEERMSDTKRRDFLKATAGVAVGSALGGGSALFAAGGGGADVQGRRRRRARSCACCAGSASCRATRTCGRPTRRSSREMTGIEVRVDAEGWEDVRPEGGGGGERRQRPGHHHQHDGGRAPVSGQAGRRVRPRQLPRQQVRRLVPARPRTTGCTATSGSRS